MKPMGSKAMQPRPMKRAECSLEQESWEEEGTSDLWLPGCSRLCVRGPTVRPGRSRRPRRFRCRGPVWTA